ncbi:RNA polymerase sigma factor [Niveispirillum cyanobacteriorum]|uniref:RNA polymerase subunit sigma-24 n=1 Tax=Niveispirillum cyanobacteriorum TaxID=1612173 RepID=A0A2K9NH66_9PROT|nr:RNA polymerase sigma factor [Niveispirillum cyanobacteriorum]AUN32437.1 RNA polymerase subunit sigma-24 [Niveispirillum cyanobacteriorum]GGE78363.1 RNA polymerase ECF-type sigma factor [Niveispirillum cyanobacteriorum]
MRTTTLDIWFATRILPLEPGLRGWLARHANDIDPDDIIQETYARLAKEQAGIRDAKAYMFAVARSIVIEQLRQRRVVKIVPVPDLESLSVADEAPTHESDLISRQDIGLLHAALAQLPEKCRQVLTLRKVDGLSQKLVARRLGLSESTVEKHVAAGIKRCAAWFAARQDAPPARQMRKQ